MVAGRALNIRVGASKAASSNPADRDFPCSGGTSSGVQGGRMWGDRWSYMDVHFFCPASVVLCIWVFLRYPAVFASTIHQACSAVYFVCVSRNVYIYLFI